MINKQEHPLPFTLLPFVLFILALGFLSVLLLTVRAGVFFSGDAGIKYLMIKQIGEGGSSYILNLDAPAWTKEIWAQGFYPFKAPFVYDAPAGKIVSFPPAFQWLNATFYQWFGSTGIYIIPSISLVSLWAWVMYILQRIGRSTFIISLGFTLLAFCSPLTVYGAIYWEHTLSTLLIFSATVFLVLPPKTATGALLSGILSGLSVWFRPETLLLCCLFMGMALFNNFRKQDKSNIFFIISALFIIIVFFVFNVNIYGNILGAHSYQLTGAGRLLSNINEKFIILLHINARQLIFFPVSIFIFLIGVYYCIGKTVVQPVIGQLTLIIILFSISIPFLLPNAGGKQWGPRYFLPLVPIVIVALCLVANQFHLTILKRPKWAMVLIPLVIYSAGINVFLAHNTLADDYAQRVKPGLNFLDRQTCDIVVVQNQYIAQEFAAMFEKKKIFLAENKQNFNRLQQLFSRAGVSRTIYIAADSTKKMFPLNMLKGNDDLLPIGNYYFAEYYIK